MGLTVGMNDATTFPYYHVFASNQIGNTALFGGRKERGWLLLTNSLQSPDCVRLRRSGATKVGSEIGRSTAGLECNFVACVCFWPVRTCLRQCFSTAGSGPSRKILLSGVVLFLCRHMPLRQITTLKDSSRKGNIDS